MCSIVDVAAYVLDRYGPMTTMKLEKMAFYEQAYCLGAYGTVLFDEDFQVWVNGPVSPVLYQKHRGRFLLHPGDSSQIR